MAYTTRLVRVVEIYGAVALKGEKASLTGQREKFAVVDQLEKCHVIER
jgi:hypothetical protein